MSEMISKHDWFKALASQGLTPTTTVERFVRHHRASAQFAGQLEGHEVMIAKIKVLRTQVANLILTFAHDEYSSVCGADIIDAKVEGAETALSLIDALLRDQYVTQEVIDGLVDIEPEVVSPPVELLEKISAFIKAELCTALVGRAISASLRYEALQHVSEITRRMGFTTRQLFLTPDGTIDFDLYEIPEHFSVNISYGDVVDSTPIRVSSTLFQDLEDWRSSVSMTMVIS